MASRRFFDGAQSELGLLPIQAEAIVGFLSNAFWGILTTFEVVTLPAPTEVGTGTSASGTGSSMGVSYPGTLVSTDVVIAVLYYNSATDPAFTCSGFTEVMQSMNNANNRTNLTVMVGTGFTGTGTFTFSTSAGSQFIIVTCTAWSGASASPVVGTPYSAGPGGSDFDIPGITTTADNTMVVACFGQAFVSAPRTLTPAYTAEVSNNEVGQASRVATTAGATGNVTVTNSAFSSAVAVLIGLTPA